MPWSALPAGPVNVISNHIIFIGLRGSKRVVGLCGKGNLGESILRGSTCTKGMGCERRWVRWVLRGTGTVSGYPGVS